MTDLNDENQNTLNIAPLRLFRGGAEVKNTGKAAPKRSMQQLHKLLLIKDEQSIDEVEQESLRERCAIHLLPMNHFCRCCIDFRLCKDCASSHEHPTIAYNSLEECLNDEAALLDSTVQQLGNRSEMLSEQLISLQDISERVATSKRNLFSRMRKFVDELENAADLQMNSLLSAKRSEVIAYEKTLRKLTSGEPKVLREQLLLTDPTSYRHEPDVQEAQEKCEVLLDKLRAFCYALRSPLVKEVTLNLNSFENTGRTNISQQRPHQQNAEASTLNSTSRPASMPRVAKPPNSLNLSAPIQSVMLEKFILKNMVDTQRRSPHNPSSLLRTLNLIGKDNSANLSLQSQRLRFGEGRANFFG